MLSLPTWTVPAASLSISRAQFHLPSRQLRNFTTELPSLFSQSNNLESSTPIYSRVRANETAGYHARPDGSESSPNWVPHDHRTQAGYAASRHSSSHRPIGKSLRAKILSNRRARFGQLSPSQLLTAAIKSTNLRRALLSKNAGTVDISLASARGLNLGKNWSSLRWKLLHLEEISRISLQSIVAKYIQSLVSKRRHAKRPHGRNDKEDRDGRFTEAELAFLQTRGYTSTDAKQWSSILLGRSVSHAARNLSKLQDVEKTRNARNAPKFLALFLLRRRFIPANALKLLLLHLWERHHTFAQHHLEYCESEETSDPMLSGSNASGMITYRNPILQQRPTNVIIIIHLIQHALRVWPAALVNIAALAIRLLEGEIDGSLVGPEMKMSDTQVADLSKSYNRILLALSHPASIDKYKSTIFQQRAQFDLLRRMAEHRPPLTVTQDGYDSIIRVQLAQAKTPQERDWASLKSRNWPPWKEDKTGLDAEKGPEYSLTRAAMAITKMQEAGYAPTTWEDTAKIYTGWDTDGTPTIQHRFFMRPPLEVVKRLDPSEEKKLQAQIWAARIRATRTVREAWACFLSCRNQNASQKSAIYVSMLEKLVYEERRQLDIQQRRLDRRQFKIQQRLHRNGSPNFCGTHKNADYEELPFPGDGKEVHPPPISPLESMYLASEPPSVETFFDEMIQNHIAVPDHCLALIMDSASYLKQAHSYLAKARQGSTYRSLISLSLEDVPTAGLSGPVLTSLIRASCRFEHEHTYVTSLVGHTLFRFVEGMVVYRPQSFLHALRLLDTLKPHHRPAWNVALESLQVDRKLGIQTYEPKTGAAVNRILPFSIARQMLDDMRGINLDLDSVAFHSLCVITERAVVASFDIKHLNGREQLHKMANNNSPFAKILHLANEVIARGSSYLQDTFMSLTTGTRTTGKSLPDSTTTNYFGLYALDDVDGNSYVNPRSGASTNALSPSVPRLLNTPPPAALHAFVRALGYARDFSALRNLTRWMVDYKSELDIQIDGARNGRRQLRNTITALAFFLETNAFDEDPGSRISEDVQEMAIECRRLIEDVGEEWGGWPSEQEIKGYFKPKGKLEADK